MKPLRLDLHAFGPFADRQTIDFGQLGDKTFFLIHGPTGSGKTSILDGICFALFGDSSGGERDGRQMRSQHAEAGTLTEVVFDFALGEQRYRVRRVPEQERPARRGGGMVKQKQDATLWQLADAGETPLAAGWSDVTAKVVELIGFESEQFRQVIMLPQGKFRDFLIAKTQEREKILQTLFGTELYKRIEEALRTAANELQRQAETVTTKRRALLDQAVAPDEATLAARAQQQEQELTALQAAEQSAAQAAAVAEKALAEARLIADRFVERDLATEAQAALRGQQPAWDERRRQLDAGRRAAAIRPYEAALREQKKQLDDEAANGRKLAAEQTEAAAAKTRADTALAAEQARAQEADQLTARIAELDALAERVASLATVRTQHKDATAASTRANTTLQAAQAQLKKARDEATRLAAEVQAKKLAAAGLDGHRATQARLKAVLDQGAALARQSAERQAAGTRTTALRRAQTAAETALAEAREKRAVTHQAWVAGQAARLARELVAGAACPVCGAYDHPAPAQADGALVEDATLQAAEAAQAAAEKGQRDAERAVAAAQEAERLLDQSIATLRAALGDAATTPADELTRQAVAADQALAIAAAAAQALAPLEAQAAAAEQAIRSGETTLAAAETAARDADGALQRLAGQLAEREAGVPAGLADPKALQVARTATASARDALRVALEQATQLARKAAELLVSLAARRDASDKLQAQYAAALAQKQGEFDRQLAAAGFADVAAWRAAALDDAGLAVLESGLRGFEASLKAVDERLARAVAATAELTRPDLPALELAHGQAQAARLAAANAVRDAVARRDTTRGFVASLQRLDGEFRDIETRYKLLHDVAEVANGRNPQRMSFQRYVLATLLEEVLVATTTRLRVMSRGRYEMRRKIAPVHMGQAAGLDLEIFDHYTGMTRPVATLSGGESFLASLALALGLSDVVQSGAGGIRLDAIFVDEGFGSLDPEALDFAIRALKDLQQAGRMVGIISHVAELKEWIDARLELKPTRKGSVAAFSG